MASYLSHDWTALPVLARICRDLPLAEAWLDGALFVGGWLLMTVAMMLPTTLPLLVAFRGLSRRRPDGTRLTTYLVAGYLGVWLAFGVVAHLTGLLLVTFARGSSWLTLHPWTISAGVLAMAGLFQLSPLKRRCLEACRTPLGFLLARWRGRRPAREALWLGVAHGAFCVGCCWALMLVMLMAGAANPAWMLILAAVMGIEKNSRWGTRLTRPLGFGLVTGAVLLTATGLYAD
jgi:predicted metal-binding membrane protein